ncbi:MAG: T9SS type A sorting domain-containing protein [Ginsengibacter sp.]
MKLNLILCLAASVFLCPNMSEAQQQFDYYISNSGNDSYPGTFIPLARQTISASAPLFTKLAAISGSVKVGLKSGDTFNESLTTSYPIRMGTYNGNTNQNDFAIMNGSKEFSTGWSKQENTENTFLQHIPVTGFSGYGINSIGSYSYIYVTEIDKALERTAPFTARKLLKYVRSATEVENTAGSCFSPNTTSDQPMLMYVHTSDGSSPNTNAKYRYEVAIRDCAVNSTYQPNNVFENLWVRGFGSGIGMLPGGDNSSYNKIVFGPGAAIHHLVVRSGIINHSLFLPGAKNTGEFAVVFYDVEGLHRHCTIKNSMFLDISTPVYAHTSLGTNYNAVELDNVVAFADKTAPAGFIYTSNNDTVLLNNVYTDGYTSGYNYGSAKYAGISNSYFKDVNFGIAYSPNNAVTSGVNNVFIKTKGTSYTVGIYMQANTSLTLANSIIHLVNDYRNYWANSGAFIYGAGAINSKIMASGNIFVCDIFPSATLFAATANTDNGIGTSPDRWDNNVYILLKGNRIAWSVTNAATNGGSYVVQSFDEWKRQSGQDKNSLFFDLRKDPRGLKAIFADPENGNYDLAKTKEGNAVAALRAGMTSPISCFLQKPSYEEAADIIRSNKTLSVNTCRNPCQQNKIKVSDTIMVNAINQRKVKVEWIVAEQQNIDHYEIQRAIGNANFKRVSSVQVSEDSVYSFLEDIQPGITYQYRLVIFAKAGGICYSDPRSIKLIDSKPFTIYPNPSNGKIWVSLNGYIGNANFKITNSTGQPVFNQEILSLYNPTTINISGNPKGIYFLTIAKKEGTSTQKFILE